MYLPTLLFANLPLLLLTASSAFRLSVAAFSPINASGGSSPGRWRRSYDWEARAAAVLSASASSCDDLDVRADGDRRPRISAAVVGAGPSGLLLAHRLLSSESFVASVSVFERRADPRLAGEGEGALAGRAYALGLNGRSRYAIRTVDDELWEAVEARGFESDKFQLYPFPKLRLKLRDGIAKVPQRYRMEGEPPAGPTVLIYQSDLCSALLDELMRRYGSDGGRLSLNFDCRVDPQRVELTSGCLLEGGGEPEPEDGVNDERPAGLLRGPFDIIAGCDGVSSSVRAAIERSAPPGTFRSETAALPGAFKVARIPSMPPGLDPDSVALLVPSGAEKKRSRKRKGGGGGDNQPEGRDGTDESRGPTSASYATTAFVEPVRDGGACILFAGDQGVGGEDDRGGEDPLMSAQRPRDEDVPGELVRDVLGRFPLFGGMPDEDIEDMIRQLLTQRPGIASSVRCNAYHYGPAVLVGDAAHATGGVSGQGVNSAFIDSAVLADCLEESLSALPSSGEEDHGREEAVRSALLRYSQRQVPEGKALYDLSFGPGGELPVLLKLQSLIGTFLDTLFGGRFGIGQPLLQVQLSSTLRSFADIRRQKSRKFDDRFPDQEEFDETIAGIYQDKSI